MAFVKRISKRNWMYLIVLVIVLFGLWRTIAMTGNIGPIWHGITVGKSTVEQLIAEMGPPSEIRHDVNNTDLYIYKGNLPWAAHKIMVKDDTVEQVEEDTSVYFPAEVKLSQIVDQYGIPDLVVWSQESPTLSVAIFPKVALLVEATSAPFNEAQVTRVFYFRPSSLTDIQNRFSDVLAFVNPFPNSDVIGVENPWESALKAYQVK